MAGAPAAAQPVAKPAAAATSEPEPETETAEAGTGERMRSSPLVRKIAKENNLDLSKVPGTGSAGRITKEDILGYLAKGGAVAPAPAAKPAPQAPAAPPAAPASAPAAAKPPAPAPVVTAGDELVPLTRMRAII